MKFDRRDLAATDDDDLLHGCEPWQKTMPPAVGTVAHASSNIKVEFDETMIDLPGRNGMGAVSRFPVFGNSRRR